MTDPLLSYKQISCRRAGREIVGLDALFLQRGDRLGIIGPNGAGKSTLLKALAMLEPPDEGQAVFEGKALNLSRPPLETRRRWACVFQHSQRFQSSVFHNVEIGLSIRGIKKAERERKVRHWLDVFRIGHLADEQAYALSGGEAQRMNLARAFVLEPDVLFLDEPFSALDFPTKMGLIQELDVILSRTNTTSVLISHDLTEIAYLTNQLLYLEDGKKGAQGETAKLLHEPSGQLAEFLKPWYDHAPFRLSVTAKKS